MPRDIVSLDAEIADAEARWYAVQVRAGAERSIRRKAEERGHRVYVPVEETWERRRGETIATERVILEGYVLARLDLRPGARAWRGLLDIPGVIGLVPAARGGVLAAQRGFVSVPDSDLMRLWTAENERGRIPKKLASDIRAGMLVQVLEGPFTSFPAVVSETGLNVEVARQDVRGVGFIDRVPAVKLEVRIFGRETPVTVPEAWVKAEA